MLSCLIGVSARAGGVVGFANVVEPCLLGPPFAAVPRVGVEGVSVPVCPSYPESCLRAGSASCRSGCGIDPFLRGSSRMEGDGA